MTTLIILGPIVIFIASLSVFIQLGAEFFSKISVGILFFLLNAAIRAANTMVALVLLIYAVKLAAKFEEENPAYPEPWPKLVAAATHLDFWQMGPIEWVLGMVCQICAILLDMYFTNRLETLDDFSECS